MSTAHIVDSYTFTAASKTVKFNDYGSIRLEGVKLITNNTTGTIIYQFNDATKNGTVTNNILTLTYNTAAMSNTDKLMIIYEAPEPRSMMVGMVTLFIRLLELVKSPPWVTIATGTASPGAKIVRASVDQMSAAVGTVTTVTTVSTLTTLNAFNSLDSRWVIWNQWNQNYRLGLRSRIS